jgi:hypothetical protein
MNFKKIRIKQIEIALETTRKRLSSLKTNNFEEIEDFKARALAEGVNLLDDYFESIKNDESNEVENLRREYNKLLDSISDLKHI